ncbi:hypothetical protein GCM10022417_15690 [Corynebacterium pilbarense]
MVSRTGAGSRASLLELFELRDSERFELDFVDVRVDDLVDELVEDFLVVEEEEVVVSSSSSSSSDLVVVGVGVGVMLVCGKSSTGSARGSTSAFESEQPASSDAARAAAAKAEKVRLRFTDRFLSGYALGSAPVGTIV